MDPSVIPAASVGISLAQTQQAASISVLKDAMDMQQTESNLLLQSMGIGTRLDVSA